MLKVGDTFVHEIDDGWHAEDKISRRRAWDIAVDRAPSAQWTNDITGCVDYQWHNERNWPEQVALVIEVDDEKARAIVCWEGRLFYFLTHKLNDQEIAERLIESALPQNPSK